MCYRHNNEILVMVFLRTNTLTLILPCICYIARFCYANSSSDSDDDSLKEALLLVDILKTEYIRALRENVAGIYREDNNTLLLEEQSTCAPTTSENYNLTRGSDNMNEVTATQQSSTVPAVEGSSGTTRYVDQWLSPSAPRVPPVPPLLATLAFPHGLYSPADSYRMTPSPDFQFAGESLLRPYKAFRRRIPRDYYYYYDQRMIAESPRKDNFAFNSRRQNVNGFNYINNKDYRARFNQTATSTSLLTNSKTFKPRMPPKNITGAVSLGDSTTKTFTNTRKKSTIKIKKKLEIKANTSIKSYIKKADPDPEPGQIAAELAREIENYNEPDTTVKGKRRAHIATTQSKQSIRKKLGLYRKYDNNLSNVKTTIRIHMERSTRYPIPLPENHAYCFTNPESALCRTKI